MARQSYKSDKRRRALDKKKKQEEKKLRKLARHDGSAEQDPNAYLEYLNPGGIAAAEDETEPQEE